LYGTLKSAWKVEAGRFVLDVTVPANTAAEVTLWDARVEQVREGGRPLAGARQRGNDVLVEVGSGQYTFTVTGTP
jgi:alpha-L-rhamnosidase